MAGSATATGGTAAGATNNAAPAPGSLFHVPKYSTQRRFVPDNGNANLALTPNGSTQVNLPTSRLDQLDIVTGIKMAVQFDGTWTQGSGETLTTSPFSPANIIQQIQFKLQAAYNSFNLTGPLAAAIQAYRPMWGSRGVGTVTPDVFATFGTSWRQSSGTASPLTFNIDVPLAWYFDEYFDLDAQGNPVNKYYDAIVSPYYMAAMARVVVPTVVVNPMMSTQSVIGAPVSDSVAPSTSTFTAGSFDAEIYRDAFWTADNPAGNPPQYAWMYTRDYFQQPTSGQGSVGVLIQNTGVSVGQVLSLWGFVYDPAASSGKGAPVPFSAISTFELVLGGSLQKIYCTPQQVTDRMNMLYGEVTAANLIAAGFFVFDFALNECGGYISNAEAINTYLINGVQLNINFKSGSVPSSTSTVYLGVEALKLATS